MTTATDMLSAYLSAEADLLKGGKSARIGDQLFTHEDLDAIRAGRKEWEARVNDETATAEGRPGRSPIYLNL